MIVLISGKQGSGKTTLSGKLREKARMNGVYAWPGGFGKAMRAIVASMQAVAKSVGCPVPDKVETRELMNFIATSWGRKMDPDFWIPPVIKSYEEIADAWKNQIDFLFIIDDFRCKNEAHAFDHLDNVFRIRLECAEEIRKQRAKYWGSPDHFSEVDLDGYTNFDLDLDTNLKTPDENCDIAYGRILEKMKPKRV